LILNFEAKECEVTKIPIAYGAVTVNVTEIVVVPFSKNCGFTAKIAGTVSPFALLRGTAFKMIGPLSAVVAE
jgi:hypothetical protein